MNWRAVGLGVFLMVSSGPAGWAQVPAGGEVRVNTFTTGQQVQAAVASTPDGRFVVVWLTGSGSIVAGQRFDRAGNRMGGEFMVNTGPFPQTPDVAMQPGGGFVVVWTQYSDGSAGGVRGRRFAADASPLGSEFQVNAYTTGSQYQASVAATTGGGFVVAWVSPQDGFLNGIMAQRFDAQGSRLGAEFVVNAYTTFSQLFPRVAADAAGNFAIVWNSQADGSGGSVNAQRYAANGTPLGAEFLVNSYTTSTQRSSGPAYEPNGRLIVAFTGEQNDAGDVFVRLFEPNGDPIGAEFQVNTFTGGVQTFPRVGVDSLGYFVVAWLGNGDPDGSAVRARRLLPDGTPRGDDFLVNTYTTGHQVMAFVGTPLASDDSGNFVVTWDGPAGADPFDVFLQRFGGLHPFALEVDPGGNRVWEPGENAELRPSWFNANGAPQTVGGLLAGVLGPPVVGRSGQPCVVNDGSASYSTIPNNTDAACVECYSAACGDTSPRPALHLDATGFELLTPDAHGQVKRWTLHLGRSFTDVNTGGAFYRFIETVLHNGVTGGCGGFDYCPAASTSREQMPVFVLVSKEGAGYAPPACTTPVFADVPASSPFCPWIEELARRGVTGGCAPNLYCPSAAVTREQMAVFLLRTLDPTLAPPACAPPNMFNDVPETSAFCPWIEELARRGITAGCGDGNYCPAAAVTREQMAPFLTVTFGLTLYGV